MLMGGPFGWWLLAAAAGIGLMGANVLVVNNYRDIEDDRAVGKRTLAVRIGLKGMSAIYLANGILAVILTLPPWLASGPAWWIVPAIYLCGHIALYFRLTRLSGAKLNPLLGMTAVLMLVYALGFLLTVICSQ